MLTQIAWRNVLRSRRRTIVTILLSTITTALFIFYMALMDGSYSKIFKDSVEMHPGYIQITHAQYRENPGYEYLLEDTTKLLERVKQVEGVAHVGVRFEGFALLASSEQAIGGAFSGIEPSVEPHISRLARSIVSGRYLRETDTNGVVLGVKLANRLSVDINDTFSVIATAADYSFAADNVRVVGIFRTGLPEFDGMQLFMNKSYYDQIMMSDNLATTIVVDPIEPKESQSVALAVRNSIDDESVRVEDWRNFMSSLVDAMEVDRISGMIMLWVFVVLIFFVVMIYAYLTIYSRTKEIGIMRALGTLPRQIIAILLLETVILALISVILGGTLGGAVAYYFELFPLSFESLEDIYQQYGFVEATLPADFTWGVVLKGCAYVFMLNLVSIIYPVWHTVRKKPIDAMHHV